MVSAIFCARDSGVDAQASVHTLKVAYRWSSATSSSEGSAALRFAPAVLYTTPGVNYKRLQQNITVRAQARGLRGGAGQDATHRRETQALMINDQPEYEDEYS